jgi:hypothetical protein
MMIASTIWSMTWDRESGGKLEAGMVLSKYRHIPVQYGTRRRAVVAMLAGDIFPVSGGYGSESRQRKRSQ